MKTTRYIKLSQIRIAIADLSYIDDKWYITRINVPQEYRGKGYGAQLLSEIIDEADKNSVDLYLQIYPSGGLTFEELEQWYTRHGFVRDEIGEYVRKYHLS